MDKKTRYRLFVDYFERYMPVAETELNYTNGFELLVAVILSAQCTDKRVNQVTPSLFEAFPNPKTMSKATKEAIFDKIRSVSYPNNKSSHLLNMAIMLVSEFGGEIPKTVDDLQKLPGVGRKTANVVASVLFGVPTMPVDTHVFRVSKRIGLVSKVKTPLDCEKQLVKNFPKSKLTIAHHWLILHGRYVCQARKPKCDECGINHFCSYFKKKT